MTVSCEQMFARTLTGGADYRQMCSEHPEGRESGRSWPRLAKLAEGIAPLAGDIMGSGDRVLTSVAAERVNEMREFFSKEKLAPELAWIDELSQVHLRLFSVELSAVLAPPSPDAEQLDALLEAWQATAELDASPELQERIQRNRRGKFESADEWLASKSIE